MDKVLADTLTANLRSAKTQDEVQRAVTLALIALVDCQLKTAGSVKELLAAQALCDSRRAAVAWFGRAVYGFATAGGFAAAVKAMKIVGWL